VSRRPVRILATALLFAAGFASQAMAAPVPALDLLDARQDYTADFSLRTGAKGNFTGRVIHAQGRERREFGAGAGPQVLILRRDLDEADMLWPEKRFYLSSSFSDVSALVGGIEEITLDRRKDGSETIGGEPCTRFAVTGMSTQGGAFHGKMWFTADGILMKASGTVRFQGKDTAIETSLAHLQRIRSDSSAFVKPSDYKGMPLNLSSFGLGAK